MLFTDSTQTFRIVLGFPGYAIGDCGGVQSRMKRGYDRNFSDQWRPIVVKSNRLGYFYVHLYDGNCMSHYRLIHRLVLEAFVGECPDGMECRHLDGDRSNNRLSNLCWGTRLENAADRDRHGTTAHPTGERHWGVKLTAEMVISIRRRAANGEPRDLIAADYPVTCSTVNQVVNRSIWKHVP